MLFRCRYRVALLTPITSAIRAALTSLVVASSRAAAALLAAGPATQGQQRLTCPVPAASDPAQP